MYTNDSLLRVNLVWRMLCNEVKDQWKCQAKSRSMEVIVHEALPHIIKAIVIVETHTIFRAAITLGLLIKLIKVVAGTVEHQAILRMIACTYYQMLKLLSH